MKKTFIAVVLICTAFSAYSQQDTLRSKNGTPILPQSNDWAIGFDASPFFDIIKGLFSSSDSSGSDYTKFTKDYPLTLYGKMVKDANTIWRVSARLNFGSEKTNYVTDLDSADGSSFATPAFGNDVVKDSHAGIMLGFGIEKRRGKGRVQGFYGPEVMVGYNTSKSTISYANTITVENQVPSISLAFVTLPNNERIIEVKNGSEFNFKLRAFAGVEYFFMAKASIAAELGWGIGYTTTSEPDTQIEYWDPSLNSGSGGTNRQRIPGNDSYVGKTSGINIDTDNAYGAINLFFYF